MRHDPRNPVRQAGKLHLAANCSNDVKTLGVCSRFLNLLMSCVMLTLPVSQFTARVMDAQTSSAGAPATSSLKQDAEAIALIEQISAANGGRLSESEGIAINGTLQRPTVTTSPIRIKAFGTRLTRTEIDEPSGTRVRVLNNGQSAFIDSSGHVKQLNELNTLAERIPFLPAVSLLAEYTESNTALEYLGPKMLSSVRVIQIAVSWGPSEDSKSQKELLKRTRHVYSIDPTTFHVVQLEYDRCAENDSTALKHVVLIYSNFANEENRAIARTITSFIDNKFEAELNITAYQDNVAASPTDFQLPEVTK